ncbi:MAG: acyl-CoA carboxylase subunit epsilon [Nocardioides sp.]
MATTLKLVRGNPTPEELGAVVALLAARSGAAPAEEPAPVRSLWARPRLRQALEHGPGAWRASGLPR